MMGDRLTAAFKDVFIANYLNKKLNWRAKRALGGEVDGKLCIAVHARMWCIFITWRVESAQTILRTRSS